MSRIYQRQNGIYYADIRLNGRKIRKSLQTKNKREAERAYEKLIVKIHTSPLDEEKIIEIDIFDAISEFANYMDFQKSKATMKRYMNSINIFAEFTEKSNIQSVSGIKVKHIEEFMLYRISTVSAKTTNLDRLAVNSFLSWCEKHMYIKNNPIPKTKPVYVEPETHPDYFEIDELKQIFSYHQNPQLWKTNHNLRHKNTYERLYPFWLALYSTGMRKGELENLEWTDVDLVARKIKLSPKDNWSPKGKRYREIPINEQFLTAFKIRKQANESDRYVFSSPRGLRLNENYLLKRLKPMLADLGLTGNVHKFRHTYASHLIMNGVGIYELKELLGHSDITTTQKYTHLSQAHNQALAEKLPKISFDIG